MKRLQELGRNRLRARVWNVGLQPALLYGAEISTPPQAMLTKMRAWHLQITCLRYPGVSAAMVRALLGAGQDPMCKAMEQPLLRWIKELWIMKRPGPFHQDVLTKQDMGTALADSLERFTAGSCHGRRRGASCSIHSISPPGWMETCWAKACSGS